ncbi:copper homeostasis protein CutC [Aerococcaceae bacterium DSM 111020]|nr:copper homeostasis protein CutC [Aerococcaceae bacterium DSM 111020]
MILEFCAENFTYIPNKIENGAKRIELCDNLAVGGTTPSHGVIKYTLDYTKDLEIPVFVMVRCRGGNFVYNQTEQSIMLDDVEEMMKLGADGLVVGALKENYLDLQFIERITQLVHHYNKKIIFHMAFDQLSIENQFRAIDDLADRGVHRILTHGGPAQSDIISNTDHLLALNDYAAERIKILPGGGIHRNNLSQLHQLLQMEEYHGTNIV